MDSKCSTDNERRQRGGLGALYLGGGRCLFRVWAPERKMMEVHITSPGDAWHPMVQNVDGYWEVLVEGCEPGARYLYRLDGQAERPDPASRCQPEGVHQASQVVDNEFAWEDGNWFGIPLARHVIYELHVGTFTKAGTFEAIIPHLAALKDLGVTTLEIMPVAQFPGKRNWGYDGAYPYAVQNSYGGLVALKRLVNAAHKVGLAVILDVVYNHLGPEGNYLGEFAPYQTDTYKTPWGKAINFDGPHSEGVRHFFSGNACYWIEEFHMDGLRLDATHFVIDTSARPFLRYLADRVKATSSRVNRRVHLFAESDANDSRWVKPPETGGFGLNAQWNDDFQHALVTVVPGADGGAYMNDYGRFSQLTKAYEDGFVFSGEYSTFRKRRHGNSSRDIHGKRLVVFAQNHDQVGNRPKGDRLCAHLSMDGAKLVAASCLLAPYVPLLFMGEEYGELAPFLYFVDHGDPGLIEAVRAGRKAEFEHFIQDFEPPDPQVADTMEQCVLDHELRNGGTHKVLWEFHRELLRLRRELCALADLSKDSLRVLPFEQERVIAMWRRSGDEEALVLLSFNAEPVELQLPLDQTSYVKLFDSAEARWLGPETTMPDVLTGGTPTTAITLPAQCAAVYVRR